MTLWILGWNLPEVRKFQTKIVVPSPQKPTFFHLNFCLAQEVVELGIRFVGRIEDTKICLWNFLTFKVDNTLVENEDEIPSENSSSEDENDENTFENDDTKKSIKSKYNPPLRFKVACYQFWAARISYVNVNGIHSGQTCLGFFRKTWSKSKLLLFSAFFGPFWHFYFQM